MRKNILAVAAILAAVGILGLPGSASAAGDGYMANMHRYAK